MSLVVFLFFNPNPAPIATEPSKDKNGKAGKLPENFAFAEYSALKSVNKNF